MSTSSSETGATSDVAEIEKLGVFYERFRSELAKRIIGQEEVIERLAIALFSGGHVLLMGVPGLAKTLLVSTIAESLDLTFSRIQFTPDLMPADITGTDLIEEGPGGRSFRFVKGPLFGNIVLADEINRAPAKTQSALLEAMQEKRVTVMGKTYPLQRPFFVLATQNPIEQEGTYRLPEAQLDRFMFLVPLDYPSQSEELEIAVKTTGAAAELPEHIITGEEILKFQALVRRMPVPDHIFQDAVRLVRMTRPQGEEAPEWVRELVTWGAGPRAVQYLILGAKARAALKGTFMVSLEDLAAVASPVLEHRLLLSYAAQVQGVSAKDLVQRLLEEVTAGA